MLPELQKLTNREAQLVELAASGYADSEVAEMLGLSLSTVRTYWKKLKKKCGATTRGRILAAVRGNTAASTKASPASPEPVAEAIDVDLLDNNCVPAALLAAALSRLDAAVVITWGPRGKIVYMNETVRRVLKRPMPYSSSLDEYPEWNAYRAPNGPRLEAHEYGATRVMKGERSVTDCLYFQLPDGRWVYANVETTALTRCGRTVGTLIIAREIQIAQAA